MKRKARRIKLKVHDTSKLACDAHIRAYHLYWFSPALEEELRGYVYQD